MKTSVTISIDTAALAHHTDDHLAVLWHVAQANPATYGNEQAGQLVEAILAAKRHPEMGYRSCLGILRLGKTYPADRMEATARRALRARVYSFQSMNSILKNQLDRLPPPDPEGALPPIQSGVEHDNIRGADYFDTLPEADPPMIQ